MTERNKVLIAHKRVPLTKILHGRSIPDAIAALKEFRAQFTEWEVLYRAETKLVYNQGECIVHLYRPENDREMAERLEQEQLAREAKLERARKKKLREQAKAEREARAAERAAEEQRKHELATFKALYKKLGLTANDLEGI